MNNFLKIKKEFEEIEAVSKYINDLVLRKEKTLTSIVKERHYIEEVQLIFNEANKRIKETLQKEAASLTSLALKDVFGEKYKLKIDFITKGDTNLTSNIKITLIDKKNNQFDILESNGGGIIDVVSFSLRIALWGLQNKKLRNVLILDEPLKFLSDDLTEKASLMIQSISKELDLQIIMISHVPTYINNCDNSIKLV